MDVEDEDEGNEEPEVSAIEPVVAKKRRTVIPTQRHNGNQRQFSGPSRQRQTRPYRTAINPHTSRMSNQDGRTINGTARGQLGKRGSAMTSRTTQYGRRQGSKPFNPLHRMDSQGFVTPRNQWRKHQKHTEIFIFNVPTVVKETDVRSYVMDKSVSVLDVLQRSHPDSRRKSFVVQIPSHQASTVMTASFWPQSIKVRRYTNRD